MSIKRKVLTAIIALTLSAMLLLSLVSIASILTIRATTLEHSNTLVDDAVRESQQNIETQIKQQLMTFARDKALLLNEKFQIIRNQTVMTAAVAGYIYTHPGQYKPRDIDYLALKDEGAPIAHLLTAAGVSYRSIRDEARIAANISDILQQSISLDIGIIASYIGSESGFLIISDKYSSSHDSRNFDVTKRGWYTGAKERGGVFWSDVFLDAAGRGASISCAMPFYDNSGPNPVFKGVAACASLLTNVREIIDSAQVGESGYVFLINDNKQIVIGPASTLQKASLLTSEGFLNDENQAVNELGRRMVNRDSGFMKINLKNENVYIAFSPLDSMNLSMGVLLSANEVDRPIRIMRTDILRRTKDEIKNIDTGFFIAVILMTGIILLTAAAAILIGRRLSYSLTAPIMQLHKEAEIISSGNLSHELSVVSDDEIGRLASTFNEMIHSIQKITREKERINNELSLAAEIQNNLLPKIFPRFSNCKMFELFAKVAPAKEVCGDFYDFYYLNSEKTKLACLIADVSGKGVPAALFTVIAKSLFKLNLMHGYDPAATLSAVNKILCEDNPNTMFVTAFICVVYLKTGKMIYANGGHNPPLLSVSGGPYQFMKLDPGMLIGISEDARYNLCEVDLSAGDKLYLYTDGVNETIDRGMNEFGNDRLLEKANEYRYLPPEKFDDAIRRELEIFMDGAEQADDITTLALTYCGDCADSPADDQLPELPPQNEDVENSADKHFETSISIPANVSDFNILKDWLEGMLRKYSCGEQVCESVVMASEEAFTNIASYAYPTTGGNVTARIGKKGSLLMLQYEDDGAAFNPLELPPPDTNVPPEDREIGGLGIYFIRKMMDDVKYARINFKNVLTLYKFIA
ncbi:MAG: SpoIIE family protein phosphatase [Spirochaetaceae bacterium]|jgi:sigma-B regulation protein RsbU (phosphoserine phosphatase)|nr:SpoIIE family protein phosphatase [Spirochaetaceae bacterium]